MSRGDDERRPWQGGESSSRLAGHGQDATPGPFPSPPPRHDLDQALRDARARQRRRLHSQLERAVQQRRAVGDHEAASLAAVWLCELTETRGAA